MKKLILLLSIVLVLTMVCIPCFAEEETELATEPITEQITEPIEETTVPEENPTLFSRIGEAFENGQIMEIVIGVAGIAVAFITALLRKDIINKIASFVSTYKEHNKSSDGKTNEIIDGVNDMTRCVLETRELLNKTIENLSNEKIELESKVKILSTAIVDLAEIMNTIYRNSSTLTLATKDLVTEKYLTICKEVRNDNDSEKV